MLFDELAGYLERLDVISKRLDMFDILAELFSRLEEEELSESTYLVQGILAPSFLGVEFNISTKLMIKAIGLAASGEDGNTQGAALVENHVTDRFNSLGDLGLVSGELIRTNDSGLSISEVFSILHEIAEKKGTGSVEAKVSRLADLLKESSTRSAKYITRFVLGKLRLGAGMSTILEALSLGISGDRKFKKELERGFNICPDIGLIASMLYSKGKDGIRDIRPKLGYPIRVALCERLPSTQKIVEKLGMCSVEVKYDGLRLQVHKLDDRIEIFSRNLERITDMFPDISRVVREKFTPKNGIIEGEVISYDRETGKLLPFQTTIQRKRKHGIEAASKDIPLKLFAFDLLYANDTDYMPMPYSQRRKALGEYIMPNSELTLSESRNVDDPKQMEEFFVDSVDKSFEGIIAKRLDAPYVAGARNFNWIKLKKSYNSELSDSLDLCIIGYYHGRGVRAELGVGAVLGAAYDREEDKFRSVTKIGTGFTDENLRLLKEKLSEIALDDMPKNCESLLVPDVWVSPRYIITVNADEITRSTQHTCGMEEGKQGYALRFPRAVQVLRPDKSASDATTVEEIIKLYQSEH